MAYEQLTDEDKQHVAEFRDAVNMSAKELSAWLKTDQSRSVGQKTSETAESTGHESGRHIVTLLEKKQHEFTAEDIHQMRRVVSYVHRHMAQKPTGDVSDTRWRYSLMNWGHDPLKRN